MSGWCTSSNACQSRALKRSSPFVMSASRCAVRLVFSVAVAMRRALARLRQLLDDQLLVRDGSSYVLTPRAERVQRQLAGVMPPLETLFSAEVFDPATAEENYRLATTDYPLLLFLPQVAREI